VSLLRRLETLTSPLWELEILTSGWITTGGAIFDVWSMLCRNEAAAMRANGDTHGDLRYPTSSFFLYGPLNTNNLKKIMW